MLFLFMCFILIPPSEGRTAALSANVGNALWVAGGQDRTMRTLDSIEWYDVVRDEWLHAETALCPRRRVLCGRR